MEIKQSVQEDPSAAYETLFGGKPESVQVADHEARRFVFEEVKIRQLPIGCYPKAFAIHKDEHLMVGLYVDRPQDWVERLHPASYNRIAEEGRRLNSDFFGYCDRRTNREMEDIRRVAPEIYARIQATVAEAAAKSPSQN